METQTSFSEFDQPQVAPQNNMTLSVVGTVLGICSPCCIGLILGIIAIVKSSQVNNQFLAGDYAAATNSAKTAKTLAYIAIGLGIAGILLNIIGIIAMGGVAGYTEMIEEYQRQMGV